MKLFTIPNFMTLGNLLAGCIGILAVFEGQLLFASLLIGVALILDFGDGFVARLLNQSSPIGKELDSLADMVTFGVLPSFILIHILQEPWVLHVHETKWYLSYIPLFLALSSALRLAKFNIDTRQSDQFIGVPTPANGLIIASLPLISTYQPEYASYLLKPEILIGYTLIMSYLLIAELPLLAFKFKNFQWKGNQIRYVFLIFSVILILSLGFVSFPVLILSYIIISMLDKAFSK
ncbi:MAG: CDP-diacylglycerol--serine O-phosphatidyltransferase, partial [Spirosomataceae bacterium]